MSAAAAARKTAEVAINRYRIGVSSRAGNGSACPLHGALKEHGRGERHCRRNRDKIMQTTAVLAIPALESRSLELNSVDASRLGRRFEAPAALAATAM